MIKKLLLSTALFASVSMISAQQMTNLVFDDVIAPTATTIELTFDYSGVAAGDVFEWQLFLADAIIDITGKVVMKNINRTKQIDVSNLKQGFYFLKTVDNRSFKFLKK